MMAVQFGGVPLPLGLPVFNAPLTPGPPLLSAPQDELSSRTTDSSTRRMTLKRWRRREVPALLDQLRPERLLELSQGVAVRLLVERRDAVAHDLDLVAKVPRVRGGVENADVRAVADQPERVDVLLTQRDVQVSAEKARVAALWDHVVGIFGCELSDDLGALRADDG